MTALPLPAEDDLPLEGEPKPSPHLTFLLNGELFAIEILAVKEIIEYPRLTEVPMMPDSVRGVINLRGAVVPVMDLLARFGRQPTTVTKRTCIVIAEVRSDDENQVIGVMVDAVNEVIDIAPCDIEPAPTFGARLRTEFMAGMARVHGKFVIVLNMDQVLAVENGEPLGGQVSEMEAVHS